MFMRFLIVMTIAVLSGCANFNSVGRSSSLGGGSYSENVAIHLDAQQRVVLSKGNMEKICSEPSPDAMAAYAAALGLGVQIPRIGGGSLAQGGSSSIADIGLRTQTITVMRDALYRICEASMNGTINEYHMPPLLVRGMDLTAVVLATEQLTGAVAASQAALVASAKASATASGSEMLRANEQALDLAKTDAANAKADYDTAKGKLAIQDQVVIDKQTAMNTATDEAAKAQLKNELAIEKANQESLQKEVADKKKAQEKADKLVADITETREGVLRQMSTSTNVETGGDKSFNNPGGVGKSLHDNSEKNIAAVATAVKEMVQHVLDKDYSAEGCLSFYGNVPLAKFKKETKNIDLTPDEQAAVLKITNEVHKNCRDGLGEKAKTKNQIELIRANNAVKILQHEVELEKIKNGPKKLLELEIEKLKLENESKKLELEKMKQEEKVKDKSAERTK